MAQGRARRSRGYLAVGALLALTAYGAADAYDVVPGPLTTAAVDVQAPPRVGPGDPARTPGDGESAGMPLLVDGGTVLAAPARQAPAPAPTALAKAVATPLRAPALGGSAGLEVRDAATGTVLASVDATRVRVPASTAKLLTGLAVATSADLAERAPTTVVQGPAAGQITLVAGGDTLLSPGRGNPTAVAGRAGLADLADQVAASLRARDQTSVHLALDLRPAAGPAYGPDWGPVDIRLGLTGPVTMLGLAGDLARPGHPAPADPAARVGEAFRAALAARMITVTGPVTRLTSGPSGGTELGRVESAPLRRVLALAMATSDNALTESLARRVAARHGVATTFPAVGAWVKTRLAAAGVDVRSVTLADASGLSRASAVSPRTLAEVLALTGDPAYRDSFGQVVADLPVSGLSGTLAERYRSGTARAAAGTVRAKTGTLTGVATLAGTLVDADGRLLLFAIMADRVPPPPIGGMDRGRAALDEVVAAVAACGCR